MVKHRDRHGRGLRGRLAWPNPYTGVSAPLRARQTRADFFTSCVHDALGRISASCPRALESVDVGIEDVPTIEPSWAPHRVPLAAALSTTPTTNGQIVIYRRPLKRRSTNRRELRTLVFRTIVEQLSEVTGISADELDPTGRRNDDWE